MQNQPAQQHHETSTLRQCARRRVRLVGQAVILVLVQLMGANPSHAKVDSESVGQAIERGKAALLGKIRTRDEIAWYVNGSDRLHRESGIVIRQRGGNVELKKNDGEVIVISRSGIRSWLKRGFVEQEMPSTHHGGPTALAALALLSAEVELSDERMSLMIDALVDHPLPEAGTYVRSLRAGVWAKLLNAPRITREQRVRFKRLLYKDVQWLQAEMKPDGAFDYGHGITVNDGSGDASNTQFANLGLWLGDLNGGEVARETWQRVERYWMNGQHSSGGWAYIAGGDNPTSSMTVAGCNSLYIVLERIYARGDYAYRRYEGCKPNRKTRKRVAQIFQAIHDGDSYLTTHPPDISQHQGYELFGIERLGLASGLAEIGGQDWFRGYAAASMGHKWGEDVIADAFTLIFLVHGQAPILIQKLKHGEDEDAWNFYFRDLHGLSIFLSNSFERLYRWQYVPADASLHTLENAPFLMISGHEPLTLSEATRRRLRTYVDNGGLILLHSDQASRRFGKSAKPIFESMFEREGWKFERLADDHPLYTCLYGKEGRRKRIPLEAISDGPRLLVVHSPVDLAGAWHQQRLNFKDIFEIMANLRVYAAPAHEMLPRVLRRDDDGPTVKQNRWELRIKRFAHGGDWNAHLGLWERRAERLKRSTGITIIAEEGDQRIDDLAEFDIVHMTTRGRIKPSDAEIDALKAFVNGGGLLLIESADGTATGNRAVVKLMRLLGFGEHRLLNGSDVLATGAFPEGQPLTKLVTTRYSPQLLQQGDAPPILLGFVEDRVGVVACPFDLSAGFERHQVWQRVGFEADSTDRIVRNILNFRLAQLHRLLPIEEP